MVGKDLVTCELGTLSLQINLKSSDNQLGMCLFSISQKL